MTTPTASDTSNSPPSLLDRVREAALARQTTFNEAIWKDKTGSPIRLAEIHRVVADFLDRCQVARIPGVVLAPMGTGKTEMLLAYVLRMLTRNPTARGAIICDKDEHAEDRLAVIRHYIESDPDYTRLFPDVRLDTSKRGRRTLAKFRLSANKHAKDASLEGSGVITSGTGGRKDFIAFDDVCTERNSILEPQTRKRVKQAFFGTWLTRIEPDEGWWFYIGTLYHADDLTHALIAEQAGEDHPRAVLRIGLSADYTRYDVEERWPGRPPNHTTIPLWEPKWTTEAYRRKEREMDAIGDKGKFLASYRNLIVDPERSAFRYASFNRVFQIDPDLRRYQHRVLYADPATAGAASRGSDFYAGVVLGWDMRYGGSGSAVVVHAWYSREGLTERVGRYLDAVALWRPHRCGIEGQHELSFAQRIEERAQEIGLGVRLVKANHRVDKEARIASIAPLIESAKILVDVRRFPWFWDEASLWPNGAHDDALDALEGAWALMRVWLRARKAIPVSFDTDRQFHAEPGTFSGYKTGDHSVPIRKALEEKLFGI